METSSEIEKAFQIYSAGGVKNKEQRYENECKIVKCRSNEIASSVCSSADKSKQLINSKITKVVNCEKEPESSKISSIFDSYYKTNILNESSDFVEYELEKKFKNKSKKCEILLCEICKEDITLLDVYSRGVHVNNCIDKQISSSSQAETQTSEAENVFILECPLCFKHFSSPELRSSHIKKCGKSKGLSIQSIIKALELQERHALERISLGLPAKPVKPVKPHKNPVIKKVITEPKNKAESDIQLARALSLSLTNSSQNNDIGVSENVTGVILKPPTVHQRPGKKTKKVLSGTPILVLRTEEERRKLLLDKVATIVSPVNDAQQNSLVSSEIGVSDEEQNDDNLEMPTLWNLSGKTSEKADYYIEQLLDWIQPSDVAVGAKLCHLSQIAGHEIVTQLPCDYTFSTPEGNNANLPSCDKPPATDSSSSSVIESLCSLVASSWMSDMDIHTACGTVIPAHKLILAVRCSPLKQDHNFCSGKDRVVLKWENISFEAALQFLNFIYTGNIEIRETILSDLFYLADKYEVLDLQPLLHVKDKRSIKSKMEVNEKMSPTNSGSSYLLQSTIQLQEMKEIEQTINESQENMNADLEIVYNCINSSLNPSQSFCGESPNLNDALPFKSSQMSEDMKNDVTYDHELVTDCSEKTSTSNCLSPKDNCSTSPVIFDVNDSDSSDNEDAELPMSCSQISASHQSHLIVEELDLCSTESNNSEDSIKFLQSSYTSCNNLLKSPDKLEDNVLSMSPKFSRMSSSSKVSSPLINDLSQDTSVKSDSKKNTLTVLSCKSNEHVIDVCDKYQPHASSETLLSEFHTKNESTAEMSHDVRIKDLCDDDQMSSKLICSSKEFSPEATNLPKDSSKYEHLKYELTTLPYEPNRLVDECSEFESSVSSFSKLMLLNFHSKNNNKIQSLDSIKVKQTPEDLNLFNNYYINNKNALNKATNSVISENIVKSSYVSGELLKDCEDELSTETSGKNNVFSVIKPYDCAGHSSPARNTASPEVLICDSDSDSKLQQSSSHHVSSLYSNNVDLSQKKIKSNILDDDSPKASSQSSQRALMYEYDPVDDPAYEPFDYETYPNESNAALLHTPASIVCVEQQQPTVEKDASVFEPKITFSKSTISTVFPSVKNKKSIPRTEILKNAATPPTKTDILHPQFQLSDSPITPLPDYKNMMTPEIKQELRKIGVKALPRKKAVAILSHIYNETHPLINNEACTASNSESFMMKISKENKVSRKRKNANENVDKPAKKQQKENHPKRSASEESDDSSSENPEWLGCVPEITFSQNNEDSPTKPSKDDIESVKRYIHFNEELYSNILCYMPLNLVDFHQELKNNDIKISIQKLMDFFDEQCITFTCPRKEEYKKKQTARSQRFRKNMIAKLSQQARQ